MADQSRLPVESAPLPQGPGPRPRPRGRFGLRGNQAALDRLRRLGPAPTVESAAAALEVAAAESAGGSGAGSATAATTTDSAGTGATTTDTTAAGATTTAATAAGATTTDTTAAGATTTGATTAGATTTAAQVAQAGAGTTTAGAGGAGTATAPATDPHRPAVTTNLRDMYDQNKRLVGSARRLDQVGNRDYAAELERFKAHWEKNKATYEALAKEHDVPAALIAALHYREGDMSFSRYLAQGDPVGKKPTNAPVHPAFDTWDEGADWALEAKTANRDALGLHADTRDAATLATYAEAYNGGGYHNRGLTNPYVWAGTDHYTGGKWTKDGPKGYDPKATDAQVGVMALLQSVNAVDGMDLDSKAAPTRDQGWWKAVYGGKGVPTGSSGPAVAALQEKLRASGHYTGAPDGTWDEATTAAVKAWQKANGLGDDGVFGPESMRAMETPRLWKELEAGEVQVKSGGGGQHAQVAQRKLVQLGYLTGSPDGSFGSRSASAVRRFQAEHDLPQTGVLDAATAKALREAQPKASSKKKT